MKKLIIILLFICISITISAQPGWVWQNPLPQGNLLYDIKFIDANTGYAVGEAGTILKTTNAGLNWIFCNSAKYGYFGKIFIVNPNLIYLTCGYFNIWKSTDAGLTWNSYNTYYQAVSIFFTDNNTGYIGCTSSDLRKTTDGGISWATCNINHNSNNNEIRGLFFLNPNTGFISNGNVIQKTTNGANNWSIVYKDSSSISYNSILFIDNSTGFAVGSGGNIRKTTDGGITWTKLNTGTNTSLNSISLSGVNDILVSGLNNLNYPPSLIIKTTNLGNNWNQVYLDSVSSVNSICAAGNNILYACGSNGSLVKSINTGDNWSKLSSGFYNNLGASYFLNSQTGYVSMGSDTILKTTNSGVNWNFINTGINISIKRIFLPAAEICYAGGKYGRIIKSTNSGNNWIDLGSMTNYDIICMFFTNSLTGYIGTNTSYNIFHTSNGGVNWDLQTIQPMQGEIEKIYFVNANTGFIGSGIGDIIKTTNAGVNWIFNKHLTNSYISGLVFTNENTGYAVSNFVYKTTNCGANWFIVDSLWYNVGWGISFSDAEHGFVGNIYNGGGSSYPIIRKTTNGGNTWTTEYPGLSAATGIFAVSADTCFITGYGGAILSYKSGFVNIESNGNGISKNFYLSQNYPNPFNPVTKIKFDIPSVGNGRDLSVKLIIYDVLGKEVATLINEQLQPGSYSVDWDASNFPSGVYFYKLESGEFSESKKMLMVK